MLIGGIAHADQYRSEARAPQGQTATPTGPEDLKQQAQTTSNPYEKALLLRELAGQAIRSKDYGAASRYLDQAIATGGLAGPANDQMKADLAKLKAGTTPAIPGTAAKNAIAAFEGPYKSGGRLTPEQLAGLGAEYLKARRYADAIGPLKRAVAEKQPLSDISWRQGLYAAYVGAGQERDAAQVLETVVRDQPSSRDDWIRLVALYLKAGNTERSQAVLEVMSRLGYLDQPDQRLQLIGLTAKIGAPYAAGSLLSEWLKGGQLPRDATNLRTLSALWIASRESQLAIASLQETLKAAPSGELYLQLGQLYLDREDYARAAEALQQGIAIGGKSGAALMTLGIALYQQADIDAAARAFRSAEAYPQSAKLAQQWASYLDSGRAREQAVASLAGRRKREDDTIQLAASGLSGKGLVIADADIPKAAPAELPSDQVASAPPRPGALSPSAASSGKGGLTPVGADQGSNADGSIPPWTGGLTRSQWPAGFSLGGRLKDPYPDDKALFTVTAANFRQYASRLSDGHKALFEKYPDYTMPVFATRRSVAFPQAIYDATQANIGKARAEAADSLEGAKLGFPFAQPKTGVEILWNHRVRYRGDSAQLLYKQAVVGSSGIRAFDDVIFKLLFRYGNISHPSDPDGENVIAYGIFSAARSGNSPEFVTLFHETLNSLKRARGIWVLLVNLGKMFRIPPIGYDQPFPETTGIQFIDMVDMYNGLFDRYVWKLEGKRELFVPYNSFRLSDGRYKNAELLTSNHFNQAGTRYELHRVWVVEATLRPGNHHAFGKRIFYVDEDSWNVVLVENYDPGGTLWRFQEGHILPLYDIQAAYAVPSLTYDLKAGSYFAERLISESPPINYGVEYHEKDFLPEVVKNKYSH